MMHFSSLTTLIPSKTYGHVLHEAQVTYKKAYLGVLPSPYFPHNLIVVLGAPLDLKIVYHSD